MVMEIGQLKKFPVFFPKMGLIAYFSRMLRVAFLHKEWVLTEVSAVALAGAIVGRRGFGNLQVIVMRCLGSAH
jgi:hypothetical protein